MTKKKMTTPTLIGRGADRSIGFDTLARMTQNEFSRMGESIDARFDKIDATLKTVLDVVLEIPSKKAFN